MHQQNLPRLTPRFRRLPIPAAIARQLAAASLLVPGLVLANPSGGVVVGGSANISTPSANQTLINQSSNAAVINWQQFDIGGNQMVQFVMPSSSSLVLNRIVGGSAAQIFGDLSANGRVFLIDPQGILFGRTASLNVGGLVASTMNISNQDFMSGNYVFSSGGGGGGSGASVVNAGHITTADGGFVVLAGDYVKNTGVIQARMGQVVLASGSAMTMDLQGNGLISFAVNQATLAQKAGVDNAGQILADGGRVLMTADTARNLVGSAVNNSGLIQAQGIASHGGEIELTASGGDISDSGTLDASSTGGAGGTVQISGDHNIDIQNGAQILANGSQGGSVSIVADGTLNTRAGSQISALGSQGPGGYTELSGHGSLFMRGAVNLGRGGTLLIDPTNLTIGAGTGTSNSATVYQNTIQGELQNGTNVQLVASNSIATAGTLNNGLLDGTNNGNGGSLTLGIGTLNGGAFSQGTTGNINLGSNGIKVDGGLVIDAGTTSGSITAGNLSAGSINLNASGSAAGSTEISVGNLVATPNATQGGQIIVSVYNTGSMQIGSASGSYIDLYAPIGNIAVTGGLTAATTGSGNNATVYISGSNGNVTVGGPISATATGASAGISVSGNSISLQNVTASGVGSASFNASATNSINIGGAVNVSAQLARSSYGSAGNRTIQNGGQASISLSANNSNPGVSGSVDTSTITTNGLSASGPNAGISVYGGTLTLNNAANGAPAVSATASGAYYSSSQNGVNQVTSNFGFGLVQLGSDNTAGAGNTGIKSGTIAVSGPAAGVQIASNNDVSINGDITVTSSNTMGINGTTGAATAGYTVLGNANLLPAFEQEDGGIRPHCCNNIAAEPFKLPPILLDSGSLQWGNTDISIAGDSAAGTGTVPTYAGNVSISGNVTANGLGESSFNVSAASLNVGGAVTVTAGQVSLMGTQQSTVVTGTSDGGTQEGYTATRTIGNGSGGAATYGRAHSDIEINGGNVSLGSLTVQGYSDASGEINGANNVAVTGNVTVDGNLGGTAAVYDESVTFSVLNGGTGINTAQTYDTHLVGGSTTFGVGYATQSPAASFSAGGLQLNGYGLVGAVINANSISAGTVSLTQQAGSFASNDPTRTATAFSVTDPGAVLVFESSGGSVTAQAQSISVNAVGPAALGMNASVIGAFNVNAGSLSGDIPAVASAKGPLQQGTPTALATGTLPAPVAVSGIDVSAGSASLTLDAASTLPQLQLATGGALSFDANGQTVSAGELNFQAGGNASFSNAVFNNTGGDPFEILSGGTLSLNTVTIGPGVITLGGNAGVGIDNSALNGTAVAIGSSAGSVAIGSSTLAGQTLGVSAATGASLTGDSYSFNQAIAIGSNAGQTLIDNNLATTGTLLVAGGSVSAQNLSGSSVTVASGGGGISTGTIAGTTGVTIDSSGGAVGTGDITAPSISSTIAGGNATFGNLNATGGTIDLTQDSGNLTVGNVSAGQFTSAVNTGNEQVGDVNVSGNNLFFGLGDVAGQTLQIGNISYAGSSPLSFNYNNASLTVGNVSAGGFSAVLGGGNLSTGNINAGSGNITLTAGKGSLGFGNLAGGNIALSTGQALSLSNDTIDASGSFSLTAGNTSLDSSVIQAGSAAITSSGTLALSGSQVSAATVTLDASGGMTISNNSLIGLSSDSSGIRGKLAANSSVSLSGGNILIDNSTVQAQQLSINGGNIQLGDGSLLNGGIVTLNGSDLINATGGASTIDAGGLAVSGNTIDLSGAAISVGSNVVSLGSDPALLQAIQAQDPGLMPASSGPNAAFSAAGGVTLGKLSIAGGYLFIQAPTLALPSLSGNSNMFVDYLPSNPAAALNVNLSQPPTGITTLVFGGTPQTGQINIGNGSQSFLINSGVNLVFASSGATYYPDSISSNATVLVLGTSVLETAAPAPPPVQLADIPLVPSDYTIDEPATGALAYSGDQGDVNASGVNAANKGLIDVQSGGKTGLSCGIGGAQ